MPKARLSEEVFISEFAKLGAQGLSEKYGMAVRAVMGRRRRLEEKHGIVVGHAVSVLGNGNELIYIKGHYR